MKKRLFLFTIVTLFWSVSSAYCFQDSEKMSRNNNSKCEIECQKECSKDKCATSSDDKKNCEKFEKNDCECEVENDDEYCTYNQCFFDKHYRKMKKILCLTRRQENCIDKMYRDFKADIEFSCCKYRDEKNKLLEMIECDKECQKDQIKLLKELKKEAKEKCKDFRDEIKEQLCKNQKSDFNKFLRCEKRKMKKIVKYSTVYKFPCVNCCNK